MQFVTPMLFEEAVGKIGNKTPIGSALMSAEWRDVPAALRERAFFSSQVENAHFLQRARDAIGDFLKKAVEMLPDGQRAMAMGSRAEFVDMMRAFALREGMGPIDSEATGGLRDITSERRLGLIFDVQTQQAGDYGYWRQGMDAAVLDEFPAQRFVRVKEVKEERASHVLHEDQVYLKTDPIWAREINKDFGVPWGPWGWGCGHDVEDVDRAEAERLGLVSPGAAVEPDVRNFNENLRASTKGLDEDLIAKMRAEMGDQLVVEGEEMTWDPGALGGRLATEAVPARVSPVSGAMEMQVQGYARELVEAGLAAIDRVHDDGVLPKIPMIGKEIPSLGCFTADKVGNMRVASRIDVKPSGAWPSLSTVHETGHFLDLEGIGTKGLFSSVAGEAGMREVLAAARGTEAVKHLEQRLANTTNQDTADHLRYLLTDHEIWARAYAQYITEESGYRQLEIDLAKALAREKGRQWTADDFRPVREAIGAMFRRAGWMP
jgi:hypothetical protein